MTANTISRWMRIQLVAATVASGMLCGGLHAGGMPLSNEQHLVYSTPKGPVGFVAEVESLHPLAYYRLNAMTGSSSDGRTRYQAHGGVTIAKPGAPLNVANNRFARFNGSDAAIVTTLAGAIDTAASLMAWVNLSSLPSEAKHPYYVIGESQNDNDLDLQFDDDNALRFNTASASHLTFTPPPATLTKQWHLVVATVDSVTKARVIYWDGEAVASDKEGGRPNKGSVLSIGANPVFAGRFFNGGIEEAALWNRALSADEVMKIYDASLPAVR